MRRFLHSAFLYLLHNEHPQSFKYGELRNITFLPVVLHFNFLFCGLFKVMKEVCSNGNGAVDCDGAGSGSPVHKAELEKVWIHNYIYVNYICVIYYACSIHPGLPTCRYVRLCVGLHACQPHHTSVPSTGASSLFSCTVALLPGNGGL